MPPRTAAGGQGQAKARVLGAKAMAPARTFAFEVKEEITECPLCVEPLDQTDQAFQPCPCGYLVCLFCYHKLKDLCNGLCPNCRREYGSALPVGEVALVADIARDAEPAARLTQAASHHPAPPAGARAGVGVGGGGNGTEVPHNAAGNAAAAARAAQAATAATSARPVQQAGGLAAAARRGENGANAPGRGGRADDAPALPSGATWATQAGQRIVPEPAAPPAPPAAPIIADVSAWPDLAAAQAPPPPQPARAPPRERAAAGAGAGAGQGDGPTAHQPTAPNQTQQLQHQQLQQQQQQHPQPPLQQQPQQQQPQQHHAIHGNGGAHAPSQAVNHPHPAHAHVLQPPAQQRVSPMTQDPVVSPEQLGISTAMNGMQVLGYQTVQVSTHAFGTARTVGVNLANGGPQPELHPEAQALRAHLEQALHAGKLTTQQASAQLLALLQHPDMTAGRPAQRPPPGFGGPPAGHGIHANGGALFSAADSQVPPIGRMQPIGTPIGPPPGIQHPQQQQQQQYPQQVQPGLQGNGNGRYVNGATKPAPGMYNLWGGALPGIDLAAGYGVQPVQGKQANASLTDWLPGGGGGGMDGMHAGALGMGFHGYHGPGMPQQGGPAKPPPPGFAPVPQAYQQQMMQTNGMQDPVAAAPQHHGEQGWYQGVPGGASFSFNNQAPGMGNGARGPPPGMSAYRPQQLGTGA